MDSVLRLITPNVLPFHRRHPKTSIFAVCSFLYLITRHITRPRRKSMLNRLVVITGAGSGLGRLFAQRFAELGAKVALLDMNADGLSETEKLLQLPSERILTCVADVTSMDDIMRCYNDIHNHFSCNVYMLINNAGIITGKYIDQLTEKDINRTINVNLAAPMLITSVFVKDMIANPEEGGHIVNVCSAAGLIGVSRMTDYCASKAGLIRFTESLREEIRSRKDLTEAQRKNIHLTCVNPFFIATGMFSGVASFPVILPILSPSWVVDRAVDGILRNEKDIFLPRIVGLTGFTFSIFSYGMTNRIKDWLRISKSMDDFKGRAEVEAERKKLALQEVAYCPNKMTFSHKNKKESGRSTRSTSSGQSKASSDEQGNADIER